MPQMPVAGAAEHTVVQSVRSSTNTFKNTGRLVGVVACVSIKSRTARQKKKKAYQFSTVAATYAAVSANAFTSSSVHLAKKTEVTMSTRSLLSSSQLIACLVCPSSPSHKSNSQTDKKQEHKRGHVAVSTVHKIKAVIHTKELDVVCSTPNNKLQSKNNNN